MISNDARKREFFLTFSLLFFLFVAPTVAGEMLADDEDALREVLRETLPIAMAQFAKHDSDVVRVYDHRSFKAEKAYYNVTENLVWWVGRGEAEHLTNYVRDFQPDVEIKKVKAFLIRGGDVTVDAALAGEMQSLDKSRIEIQEGSGDGGYTNLVVAFDTAQPGDLIGISIQKKISHGLQWTDWTLAGSSPAARCELEIQNSWDLAFAVFGSRFRPGAMQKKILKKDKGHIRHLKLWADDIDPIYREPYAPDRVLQVAQLQFGLAGRAHSLGQWGLSLVRVSRLEHDRFANGRIGAPLRQEEEGN